MRKTSVFLLSDARSGSTLLDQCLGGHPDIVSLGEVHWLPAYAAQDRSIYDPAHPLVCTCERTIPECPFWATVEKALGRKLETLQLHTNAAWESSVLARIFGIKALGWLYDQVPSACRRPLARRIVGGQQLARDCIELFDVASAVARREICVDSSKSSFRFRAVHGEDPSRTRAIVLTRDVNAVVYSKMKRGRSLEGAAAGWRRKMRQIDALTRDLPRSHVHLLKYESFCDQPQAELAGICRFLGIRTSDSMLQRSTKDTHHIGGSPSKFDKGRIAIELDRSFEKHLVARDLRRIADVVRSEPRRWGY